MWSSQLPDAASPQAWSTAGVLGLMAGWYMRKRLLSSLAPEGPVLAGLFCSVQQACSGRKDLLYQSKLPLAGPYELVLVGVHW